MLFWNRRKKNLNALNQLKVKRGDLAKEFELIKIAKAGDVGIDLPVCMPYKDGYELGLEAYRMECLENDEEMDEIIISEIKHGFVEVKPGGRVLVPTDIRVELPNGYWASIEARSSTSKLTCIVPKGVIDTGYRGELFVQIINVGTKPVVIHHGDRLAQMILHESIVDTFEIVEVDELSASERGETGFGSSGKSATKVK